MHLWSMIGCVVLLTACHKQESILKPAENVRVAQTSPWREVTSKDNMTDKVTHMIITEDAAKSGSMTIVCDDNGERVAFNSDIFLANGELGKIMLRYDDGKAAEKTAFLAGNGALFVSPKIMSKVSEHLDRYLFEIASLVEMMNMREPHTRLRIRLTGPDGGTKDLDFPITGNQPRIAKIEKQCGIANTRLGRGV